MTSTIVSVPSDTQVRVERAFDASVEAVYAAYTTAESVRQWMPGPAPFHMPVCEMDVRPGGAFRYEFAGGDEDAIVVTGTYQVVEPPHRTVHVEDWNDGGPELTVETEFEERGGQCVVIATLTFASKEALEAAKEWGMLEGYEAAYAKLDEILAA